MLLQLKVFVAAVIVVYTGLCVCLFALQRKLIYFPTGEVDRGALQLATPVGPVRVSVIEGNGEGAVIYFGGNAEDVRMSMPLLKEAFAGRSLYLMHYRGYGGSAGEPTEEGLAEDALALYELVAKRHKTVAVVGRSLGSGVAVRLASERQVAGLVLVTPFDSVESVAKARMWFVPVGLLLRDKFESVRYAPKVRARTLLIAAERDEVIGRAHTEALARSFVAGVAKMVVVPRRGHNDIQESADYAAALRAQAPY